MLAHYALDRHAHPFIYAQEYQLIDLGTGLEKSESKVHAVIESDLDSMMLWRHHGKTVEQERPADVLLSSSRTRRVAGALVAQAAGLALGSTIEPTFFSQALEDMERFYQLSEPAGSNLSGIVGRIEKLVSKDSLVESLGHKVVTSDVCPWANELHSRWTHPFTSEDFSDSFQDRFDQALGQWPSVVEAFLGGRPCSEITGHVDYSGRALGADEAKSNAEPIRPWRHR